MSSSVLNNKDEKPVVQSNNGTPEPPDDRPPRGDDEGEDHDSTSDIKELRKLIVKSEEVGEVLPSAVKQSAKKNNQLSNATLPLVEDNIRQSVARNPKVLAEALFPAIGPAIRRAIAQALSSMVQSFNQTLEYSISPKGIGWRLEAFRTGKSFGEIVMLKTLLYRVEQVFLIHKDTGLLLQHVAADRNDTQDGDMVSAMLTAISDFVHDSFKTTEEATLDSLKVKELSVWIEHSPDAVVAAVIRGTPPMDLRDTFSEAIEEIQSSFEIELENFDGETDLFDETRPILNRCLQFQVNAQTENQGSFLKPTNILAGLIGGILLIGAIYFGWQYWRWSNYLDGLRNEPGIVVAESRFGIFQHSVRGLRDPLAKSSKTFNEEFGFDDNDIAENWKSYNDGDALFVIPRAEKFLKPPEGVKLSLQNGILSVDGNAPTAWVSEAAKMAPALVGVNEFRIADSEAIILGRKIESHTILFNCNTVDYVEDQDAAFSNIVQDIEKLIAMNVKPNVQIRGHATEPGTYGTNEEISKQRAEKVYNEIFSRSEKLAENLKRDPKSITIVALGETQRDVDCKVSFKVNFQ